MQKSNQPTAPHGHTVTIRRPDDFHVHFRDGQLTPLVMSHVARQFARAIAMPNLAPPVTTTEMAQAYRQRLLQALPPGFSFEPLMTLYLTDNTTPEEIRSAKASGIVHGVKFYPANATTNSQHGVTSLEKIMPTLAAMEKVDLPLLVHGEVNDPDIDIFDREKCFIDRVAQHLLADFPGLRIVFEHVTTREMVDFIMQAPVNIGATVTPHHLLYDRNILLSGGIKPHYYCMPILKRRIHCEALVQAVLSGSKKFFAGTDTAPHSRETKESACGCAGIYAGFSALELYAEIFDLFGNGLHIQENAEKFENFMSENGAKFYKLPLNKRTITLRKEPLEIPATFQYPDGELVPLRAGQTVAWRMIS